jgi:hypothetical protein
MRDQSAFFSKFSHMSKVTVLYNQDYADHPEAFPGKKRLLDGIQQSISKTDSQPVMRGIRFEPGPTGDIHDHVANQIQTLLPDIMSGKIVTCFGDSGNGLVLGAFDQIGRYHEQKTGTELSNLVRNPVYLAPGGTYNHGPIAMGTDKLAEVADFAGNDNSGYKEQPVRIRNARVVKNKTEDPEKVTEITNHPFFAFAGMFFDAYILEKNEKLGRKDGYLKNSFKVIAEAMREVFGGNTPIAPESRLRAFTTLPRWGMARFEPEVESLDSDEIFLMASEQAGPMGMLKIASAVNIIGASRDLLSKCLQHIEQEVSEGKVPASTDVKGILRKFEPKKLTYFSEQFDPKLLGGLNYSTDGFPHRISLQADEEARLEISTIPDSKVHIVRKIA